MKKVLAIILTVILCIAPVTTWAYSIVKGVQFNANCGEYLKLAADATNIEIAEKHLSTAISYLEEHNLTSGYTKIFIYRPTNDIGMWYENLKTADDQLKSMMAIDYTELEQSNMLMKLRETILDGDGVLTHPEGISMATNYTLMFWLNCLLWIPCWFFAGFVSCSIYEY